MEHTEKLTFTLATGNIKFTLEQTTKGQWGVGIHSSTLSLTSTLDGVGVSEGVGIQSSTLSLTSALDGVGVSGGVGIQSSTLSLTSALDGVGSVGE